jgi:hypothetical protein
MIIDLIPKIALLAQPNINFHLGWRLAQVRNTIRTEKKPGFL